MPPPTAVASSALARSLATLSPRTARLLSGRKTVSLDGQELDPGIQLMLRLMVARGDSTFISGPDADPVVERLRTDKAAREIRHWSTAVGDVRDIEIDGDEGRLRARHYAPPASPGPAALIVFIHGGGFVVGSFETHDEACRLFCRHAGAHVLAIDYRLAPEHPFPAAVNDARAAFRWAHANAAALGADPTRIAIAGDSAGDNLAAVTALGIAREGGPAPALQVLLYPVTDFESVTQSHELFAEGFFLDKISTEWCIAKYLPDGVDRADPRLSPLRAPDLSGLAPAIVITAAFDPLRDEGEAYARRLRDAGNRVESVRVPGLIHGFINLTIPNRASRDATIGLAGMIRGALMPL
jgi:acetyl esterase